MSGLGRNLETHDASSIVHKKKPRRDVKDLEWHHEPARYAAA